MADPLTSGSVRRLGAVLRMHGSGDCPQAASVAAQNQYGDALAATGAAWPHCWRHRTQTHTRLR